MAAENYNRQNLIVSGAPHIHGPETLHKIMWGVVIALVPLLLISIYFFGVPALLVILTSVGSCLIFEYLIQKFFLKKPCSITDGSAVITGLLLAFNLPSNLPLWVVIIGALVAIGIAKMAYGGLGNNPFNPALVARVFLLISFPVMMTTWPTPDPIFGDNTEIFQQPQIINSETTDALTGPTPLGIVKDGIKQGIPANEIVEKVHDSMQLLVGARGGALGEISILAILIGGLFMLFRRIITWHIPLAFIGSAFIFASILWGMSPDIYPSPIFTIFTGGLMLGAVFMATDMVTSPITPMGKIIFGIGCGVLTVLIRIFGSYPEGVSFAILIMNAMVPLINRGFKPKRFGY